MARWETDPQEQNLENLNRGQEYSNRDGVTYDMMNKIVHELIYLYNRGGFEQNG